MGMTSTWTTCDVEGADEFQSEHPQGPPATGVGRAGVQTVPASAGTGGEPRVVQLRGGAVEDPPASAMSEYTSEHEKRSIHMCAASPCPAALLDDRSCRAIRTGSR
jgi:hypothetical protein